MTAASGPLAGVRIVEIDAIGPVPLAAMILADMGADIVRISRPRSAQSAWDDVGGAILHRGRHSIELDLKTQTAAAMAVIANADVLIEGMRPGTMERLRLGPDQCLGTNPRLVYGRVTGWGQTGPLASRAGHDINFIALAGALNALGAAGAPPPVPLNYLGDYAGGAMFLVAGVLAALLEARATGRGQVVDAAMTDGVAVLSSLFHAFLANGLWRNERGANLLDGSTPYYRCYRCADGRYLAVGALEPVFFRQFVAGLGLDPDDIVQHDREGWPEMTRLFAEIIGAQTRDHWAERFALSDACATPVLDWDEAREHPHNAARGTFRRIDGVAQAAPAPRFSSTPSGIRAAETTTTEKVIERWRSAE